MNRASTSNNKDSKLIELTKAFASAEQRLAGLAKSRLQHDEDTMIENLYELVGGHCTIETATKLFYDKVLQDDSLRHFFEGVDMAHIRSRQAMLVSMLLGGRVYTGKNIHDAHAHSRDHGLNDAHFDLFLKHFRAALEEVGVKPENAEKVMKRLESKRGTVVEP